MESLSQQLRTYLVNLGAADVGFSRVSDGPDGLMNAVTIVARLSDAIVEEITDQPTYTYFHHYRTINTFLDQLAQQAGIFLQRHGYRYITVAASQSIPAAGSPYAGRYSHKKCAVLAGLGAIGKSNLFLHRTLGPRVRLATVFTDLACDGVRQAPLAPFSLCGGCRMCIEACPANAISFSQPRFTPQLCSDYMKQNFRMIGRGAVCGVCMRVCPAALQSPDLQF